MLWGKLVKRRWGWYWTILDRKHFKVKLLRFKQVKSQCMQMSMQKHVCRNELWLFLKGHGWFHNDTETDFQKHYQVVHAGEYHDVLAGNWHTFFPFCKTWVLEVQYGERCDESDIIRT